MKRVSIGFIVGVLAAGFALADDKPGVLAAVDQIVEGFNKGDTAMFLGACDKETAIVDEVPPHEWHGPDACSHWMKDYGVFVEKEHIEDAVTTLGKPHRIQVSGDHAYVVMGATCDYKQQGKPVHENVIITLALHEVDKRWRLSGWVWGRL
jgi:hypothetical protein